MLRWFVRWSYYRWFVDVSVCLCDTVRRAPTWSRTSERLRSWWLTVSANRQLTLGEPTVRVALTRWCIKVHPWWCQWLTFWTTLRTITPDWISVSKTSEWLLQDQLPRYIFYSSRISPVIHSCKGVLWCHIWQNIPASCSFSCFQKYWSI